MRNFIYAAMIFFIISAISGCETVPKKFKEEVSGIKTRVETLESRVEGVESKQTEAERSTTETAQALDEMKRAKEASVNTNVGVKSRHGKSKENTKEIQAALKNAGFYNGRVDGVKGRNTRKAIKEFQKANGLTPDGIVGSKTRELLSKYATAPAAAPAQAATGTEEGTAK